MSWLYLESYLAQRPWLCTVLSGVGMALSFPPFPFPFLAWVALVPLLLRWRYVGSSQAMWSEAFVCFLVMAAVAFSWPLLHALPLTAIISLSGIVAIPLIMAVPFGLSIIIRRWYGVAAGFTSLVVFLMATEFLLSRGPFAFPWLMLGHSQADALSFNQFADITGVGGLSLWVILLNGLGMAVLTAYRRTGRTLALAGFVAVLLLPAGYTMWRLPNLEAPGETIPVAYVQPAISPLKWAETTSTGRIETLKAISDSLIQNSPVRPEIILWPETAIPIMYNQIRHDNLYKEVQDWVDSHGISLLTGAITLRHDVRVPFGDRDRQVDHNNSAILFNPGNTYQRYDKNYLVPFAEGVPLAEEFHLLEKLAVPAGGVSSYRRGTGPALLKANGHTMGALICFEGVFGDYARQFVNKGSDFLVVLSQNGWWGDTPGHRQHFSFSRLRAIELRRAVVHANVSTSSAIVHPSGIITDMADWMERTATVLEVPVGFESETVYARAGDVIGRVSAYIAFFGLLVTFISFVYTRRRYGKYAAYRDEPRLPAIYS